MTTDPLAFFLTIHTYGSWLHGAEAGSVDELHRLHGTPFAAPNPERETAMRRRMKGSALTLTTEQQQAIHDSCLETCRHRQWRLWALHVRTTHLHIVVAAPESPEKVMNDVKSYATRHLRWMKLVDQNAKVWSRHGSTRYLWRDDEVIEKVGYVVKEQGIVLMPLPFIADGILGP